MLALLGPMALDYVCTNEQLQTTSLGGLHHRAKSQTFKIKLLKKNPF